MQIGPDELSAIIRSDIRNAGGPKAWSEAKGVTYRAAKSLLYEGQYPSATIAAKLGYERKVVFVKKR